MEKLVKNSKQWWSLNKRFLGRQASLILFPPLTNRDGIWCKTLKSKADAFAICWAAKCDFSPELFELFFYQVAEGLSAWSPIRTRDVKNFSINDSYSCSSKE